MKMGVNLCGVELKNPVIAASGTFGFGREYDKFYNVADLGGISVKGLTRLPRLGNPPHRITETPSGMLNSVGLQNPGVEAFIENDLPWLLEKGAVVVANAAGSTEDDYCYMAERLSPNRHPHTGDEYLLPQRQGGRRGLRHQAGIGLRHHQGGARALQKAVDGQTLAPMWRTLPRLPRRRKRAAADAISLINTLTGMAVDIRTRRPVLKNVVGGMSGPAVRPVALRMCWQAAKAVNIPVVGMGGIETGEDAIAFLMVGCAAVQVGSANLYNPYACPDVIRGIEAFCKENGIEDVNELVGSLRLD